MSENNFIARPALAVYNNGGGDLPSLPYYIAVGAENDTTSALRSGSVYIYDIDGTNEVKITASDGAAYDNFGWSVAVGANKIAIGATSADENGNNSGSVYIYDLDGANEVKITSSDNSIYDNFGYSVAIGGNKIMVGAYGDNNTRGSVYVYDINGTNEVKITASDGASGDSFGWSVATDNNKIVVGAYHDDDNGTDSGSVYVYDLDGTNEVKITASDGAAADRFGHSVAIGDNKIVVGAWRDTANGLESGSVYVYDLDGTNEVKITASDGAANDRFGYSVAVANNKIVVGAYGDNNTRGSVYVYDLDGTNEVKIIASDGANTNYFGYSVAVANNKIVVGANVYSSGSVYVYDLDGTNEVKITASDGAYPDYFGWAVAIGN